MVLTSRCALAETQCKAAIRLGGHQTSCVPMLCSDGLLQVEKNSALRVQLAELRDAYQVTSEEHQTVSEELKSTNEELLLINEDHRKRIWEVTRLHEVVTSSTSKSHASTRHR